MDEGHELYVRARPMQTIDPEPIHWIWKGRMAEGMVSLIDGDPGTGKSTLALDLAARITTGRPLPGDVAGIDPHDVLIFAGEDDPAQTIRPRLDNAGADVSRVVYLDTSAGEGGPSYPLSLPRDLEALDNILSAMRPRLILMDPLMMFFGGDIDTSNDSSVRVVLSKLAAIAGKHHTAILLARHLTKAKDTDPMYRGQGSIGIIGAARFSFIAATDPYDPSRLRRILAPVKQNVTIPAPALAYTLESVDGSDAARIEWHGEVDITDERLAAARLPEAELNALLDSVEWVRYAMRNGPVSTSGVKGQCGKDGFEFSEIKKALQSEGIRRVRNTFTNEWEYQYPDRTYKPPDRSNPDTWTEDE